MPNLEGSRKRVERLMTGSCTITRAPLAKAKATMNETTFELHTNPSDIEQVYSGKCYVTRENRQAAKGLDDGTQPGVSPYFLAIPLDTAELSKGLYVSMTASADPALVGKQFRIDSTDAGEIVVWRSAKMSLVESTRDG